MKYIILFTFVLIGCQAPSGPKGEAADSLGVETITEDAQLAGYSGGPGIGGAAIDGEFIEIAQKFIAYNDKFHGRTVPKVLIAFGDTKWRGKNVIGYCSITPRNRMIVIDRSFWMAADALTKESLLFHELGHCALTRAHKYDRDPATFRPISLMNSNVVRSNVYSPYYGNYVDELFMEVNPQLRRGESGMNEEEIEDIYDLTEDECLHDVL